MPEVDPTPVPRVADAQVKAMLCDCCDEVSLAVMMTTLEGKNIPVLVPAKVWQALVVQAEVAMLDPSRAEGGTMIWGPFEKEEPS